jgi:hypothetical protein
VTQDISVGDFIEFVVFVISTHRFRDVKPLVQDLVVEICGWRQSAAGNRPASLLLEGNPACEDHTPLLAGVCCTRIKKGLTKSEALKG